MALSQPYLRQESPLYDMGMWIILMQQKYDKAMANEAQRHCVHIYVCEYIVHLYFFTRCDSHNLRLIYGYVKLVVITKQNQ